MPAQLDLFAWVPPTLAPAPASRPEPEPEIQLPEWDGSEWNPKRAELKRPLRDYQTKAREDVHRAFESGGRCLIVAATGAGKTVIFSAIAADVVASGGRVLILTDQFDLVDQAAEKLLAMAGIYADIEQADRVASPSATVVVATVQTMGNRLDRYPADHFALVIADECDRAIAPMWQAVLEHFHDNARVLGVTATPNRADRKTILRYFQRKVFEVTLPELIARGYLVGVTVAPLPLTIDLRDAEQDGGDYDPEKLGNAVEACFGSVCDAIKEHAPKRKILVFLPDVALSKKFAALAVMRGLNARHVDGESRDRAALKRGFGEWRPDGKHSHNAFQILCNPMLLSRGYDEPSVDCVINLRPTGSESLYAQIIGRGTRLWCPHGCGGPCDHEDRKKDLLVMDFLYQFKAMGPVRPSALITDSPEKRQAIEKVLDEQGRLDLTEATKIAEERLAAALVAAFERAQAASKGGKGEYFNALAWAANLNLPELIDYQPETDAEAAPVPDRLAKKLKAAGFIGDSVACAGQAERILAALKARKEAGLASPRQVFWLRKWGYPEPEKMAAERAKSIMARKFREMGKF